MSKESAARRILISTMAKEIVDDLPKHWFGKVTVEDVVNALQFAAITTAVANPAEFFNMTPEAMQAAFDAVYAVKETNND